MDIVEITLSIIQRYFRIVLENGHGAAFVIELPEWSSSTSMIPIYLPYVTSQELRPPSTLAEEMLDVFQGDCQAEDSDPVSFSLGQVTTVGQVG